MKKINKSTLTFIKSNIRTNSLSTSYPICKILDNNRQTPIKSSSNFHSIKNLLNENNLEEHKAELQEGLFTKYFIDMANKSAL